jgi:uncharacterized OsmC-like protein
MNDTIREYTARARSTDTFGRVHTVCRNHHVIVDGPVWNGCPGEAVTPGELFLASVAACGVELAQVIARERAIEMSEVTADITARLDRSDPVRSDLTVFNAVRLRFEFRGIEEAAAAELVDGFRGRCPLFGTLSAAVPDVTVEWTAVA